VENPYIQTVVKTKNMSVLMQFAMFPTDKGISVSKQVSSIIEMIKNSGIKYKLGSMGTTVETETFEEALGVLRKSFELLESDSDRIYASINFDIKKGNEFRMEKKIESIEQKIGKINK
jgi:uncharacterized protein (TIGR00106 family)